MSSVVLSMIDIKFKIEAKEKRVMSVASRQLTQKVELNMITPRVRVFNNNMQ